MLRTPPQSDQGAGPMMVDDFFTPITSQKQETLDKRPFIQRGSKRKKVLSPLVQDVPDQNEFHKMEQSVCKSLSIIEAIINNQEKEVNKEMILTQTALIKETIDRIFLSYNTVYSRASNTSDSREIKEMLELITDNVLDIKENIRHEENPKPLSYANVVKVPGINKPIVPKAKPAVLVYPDENKKDTMNTSKMTKEAVMKAIKPSSVGIHVVNVKEIRNAGICIQLENEDDANKLQANDAFSEIGVTSRIPGKKNPRIAIYNIPSDCEDHVILDELVKQVPNIDRNNIKIVGKMGPKNRDTYHAIIECDPEARRRILEKGKLYLEWSACPMKDHISILQCYKCQEFGHLAQNCTSDQALCRFCGGGHESRACQEKGKEGFRPHCVLCKRFQVKNTDHVASDVKLCEIWKRKYMATLRNINYE
ncbi:hypothetical protein M8J75_002366 [Diaphorina citri]|nr:hypothetical protein M8J75_002366 [Diaphorina citri]